MEQPFDEQTTEYARFRALNYSQTKAAQAAGFSRPTAIRREKLPGFDALVSEFRRAFREAEEGPLSLLVPDAWDVLRKALGKDDVDTAKYIINRKYGLPVARSEIDGHFSVDMTPEEWLEGRAEQDTKTDEMLRDFEDSGE